MFIDDFSHGFGTIDSAADPCFYTKTDGLAFLSLYVDDMLLSGGNIKATEDSKNTLLR